MFFLHKADGTFVGWFNSKAVDNCDVYVILVVMNKYNNSVLTQTLPNSKWIMGWVLVTSKLATTHRCCHMICLLKVQPLIVYKTQKAIMKRFE